MELGLEKYQAQLDKLAKLPRAARLGIAPVLCALVFGAYAYFLFMPARVERVAAREQQLQLQRRLAEVRAVAGNEEQVKAEIASLGRRLKWAIRQLPNGKELPGLLTDVSSLAKNAGLDVKSFRPGGEVHRAFYAEVPIDLEFTGRYHDIARFFDDVSQLPRIVNIGEMEVKISRENETDTFLAVSGKATTFRFIDDATPAADAAAAPGSAGAMGAGVNAISGAGANAKEGQQ
jgi:type IV pilus assembly protein PilO